MASMTWAIANGAFREWYLIYWLAFVALADLGVDAALEADASLRAGLSIRGGEVIDTRILA